MGQNHRLLISNVFTIGFAKRRSIADRRCHPSSTETISRQLLKPDSAQLLYEVICSSPLQLPVPDPLQPMQDIVFSSCPETPVPDSPQPMQEIVSSQPLQFQISLNRWKSSLAHLLEVCWIMKTEHHLPWTKEKLVTYCPPQIEHLLFSNSPQYSLNDFNERKGQPKFEETLIPTWHFLRRSGDSATFLPRYQFKWQLFWASTLNLKSIR